VGWAPALALRTTYVGELGWELHIPTEYVRDVYDKIVDAGQAHGLRDVGYRALETLRLEKHYLAWAVDIRADTDPYEAGLGFAVRPDKPELLAGPRLREVRATGPARRLCWFDTDAERLMDGGEMLVHQESGERASVRSAGFGHTVGRQIFSALLPTEVAAGEGFEVEIAGERHVAHRQDEPPYDPRGERIRA
jgi:4-methylaminobutanoate oxidase (formaldehyde-forming)